MYMRLVEATAAESRTDALEQVYKEKILGALEQIPGCLFAGLLKSTDRTRQYISLTLWKSEKAAKHYVQSGEYDKNVELVRPMIEDRTEWKIELSKEHTIEYKPAHEEPSVKSFSVASTDGALPSDISATRSFLRILSLKVKRGDENEFTSIYNNEIIPELKSVDGCRYAFLIDNAEEDGEMLSFTLWDDSEAVEQYEGGGKFKELLEKVRHTLGDLYQWKMALENHADTATTVTSQDIDVSKFFVVTGKKF